MRNIKNYMILCSFGAVETRHKWYVKPLTGGKVAHPEEGFVGGPKSLWKMNIKILDINKETRYATILGQSGSFGFVNF